MSLHPLFLFDKKGVNSIIILDVFAKGGERTYGISVNFDSYSDHFDHC